MQCGEKWAHLHFFKFYFIMFFFTQNLRDKRKESYFSIAVVFHRIVYFIYFMCKHIKLRDDEFPPEGLNQQHNVSADAPGRR